MNISTKDALHILALKTNATSEDIKFAYRKACSMYHPDRNDAGLEMMKLVNAAYASLENYVSLGMEDENENTNYGEEINLALNAIINLGLTIEICGSWVWVSGDTRPCRDVLKEAGFKWAPKKMMWHFRPSDYKSYSKGKFTMDQIREKHGSTFVKSKQYTKLSIHA